MDSAVRIGSSMAIAMCSSPKLNQNRKIGYGFRLNRNGLVTKIAAISPIGYYASPSASYEADSSSVGDVHRRRSSLESLFCYDKPIPEERIEKPVGLSLDEKEIGDNPRCSDCHGKGAVLCTTCSGSGLYVDSILESQGIIVKVRCLGCGGTGNIMCSDCGGRGHLGPRKLATMACFSSLHFVAFFPVILHQ